MKEWSKFKVVDPKTYDAYPLTTPDAEVGQGARHLRALLLEKTPQASPKTAVWVVHGMGQQVPFATLEQVAEGIIGAAGDANVSNLQFRQVQVGTTVLQRVELTVKKSDGTQREVDVYECYWAPKTEGVVNLRNVIDFLWDGGSRGLINFFSKFERALFGTMVSFKLSWRTPAYLLITLATLAALIAINAIILATGATIAGIGKLPDSSMVNPLTAIAGLVSAAAITFGVVLLIAEASRPARSKSYWGHTIRNLVWFGIGFTIVAVVAGACVMGVLFWGKWNPRWLHESVNCLQTLGNLLIFLALLLAFVSRLWRRRQVSQGERPETGWFSQLIFYMAFVVHLAVIVGSVLIVVSFFSGTFADSPLGRASHWASQQTLTVLVALLGAAGASLYQAGKSVLGSRAWVWPFLVIVSAQVRSLMVEYVGDVTAYVASNKVDRFDDLRATIKALAKESLSAVYSAKPQAGDQFEYEKICIVGHSLGSVIAYDTLNRLIADDQLASSPARVADRTGLLLTFGSPLDKTAFFFSVIGKTTRHIREQLAAVVQPLIEDRAARDHIEWVNVFSRNDIISGSLDFYQFPDPVPDGVEQVRRVVNVKDEDALVPLIAHVEYWSNKKVWEELLPRL
jgi:hypothetical protein